MTDDSKQRALIKELLILNRAEGTSRLEPLTTTEVEELKSRRTRLRQELVHVLHRRADILRKEFDKRHGFKWGEDWSGLT